jgi:hypothetical protein
VADYDYDVERARDELASILDLDVEASWDDIIAYTAKAKGSLRMANAAVKRRSVLLAEALHMDPSTTSWPRLLERVKELMNDG